MSTASFRIFLIALSALWLSGCITTAVFKEQARLECPVPPPAPCAPGHFSDTTIDTSSAPKSFAPHYLTITKVSGLDTHVDEFAVAFEPRERGAALVTLRPRADDRRRDEHDEIVMARFQAVDKATVDRTVDAGTLQGSVGGGAITNAGDSLLFAAHPAESVMGDYDLFAGTFEAPSITTARRSPLSQQIYWDAQPALSPDGSTLYFASDRRGSLGGTDIFVTHRAPGGDWSAPVNVGPGVNTPCDELSPFVSGDGKWLYFSSAGHSTVGGYDLFRASIVSGQIGNAENLGRPINTPADELFPSAPANADPDTLLYYSSNQTGSAGFDIYVLHRLPRHGMVTATKPRTVTLKGTVRDGHGRPVDSARVTVEQRDPPGDKDSTVTSKEGDYRIEVEEGKRYEVTAGSDSTLFVREEVRIPISDGRREITHDVTLSDTVTFRVNFPFDNASDPYEFTLDDHGLPSDLRWNDMIDHAAEFLKRFNDVRGMHFLIVGHTDPDGSDEFNLDLGQRRAEFIRRELVRRGVHADRLSVESRGESQPLARGQNEPEEQYHARLRRVELIRKSSPRAIDGVRIHIPTFTFCIDMKHIHCIALVLLAALTAAGCFSITRTESDTYTITKRDTTIHENVRNVPGERDNGTIYPSTRTVEITRNYVNRDSVVKRYYPAFLRLGGVEMAGFIGTGGSTAGGGNGLFGLYNLLTAKHIDSSKIFPGFMYRFAPYEVQMRVFNDDPNWTLGTAAFEMFINQRDSSAGLESNESLSGVLPIYIRKRFFIRDQPPYIMVVPFFGLGLLPSQYVNLGATLDVGSYGGFNIRAYAGYVTGTRLLLNSTNGRFSSDVSFPYVGLGVSALDFVNHPRELDIEWKDQHHNAIEVSAFNFDLTYSFSGNVTAFGAKNQALGSFPTGIALRLASANVPLPIADGNFFVGTTLFNLMAISKAEVAFGFLPLRVGYRHSLLENDLNLEPFAEFMYYPATTVQVGVKTSLKIYDWTRMSVTAAYVTGSPNFDVLTGFDDLKSIGNFSTFYVSVGLGIGDVIHTASEVLKK